MDVRRAGLDRAVQEKVAGVFRGEEDTLKYFSVVHAKTSLNKTVKVVEQLAAAVYEVFCLTAQNGVCELGGGGAALVYHKPSVTERIFDIEQFFGTHFRFSFLFCCRVVGADLVSAEKSVVNETKVNK